MRDGGDALRREALVGNLRKGGVDPRLDLRDVGGRHVAQPDRKARLAAGAAVAGARREAGAEARREQRRVEGRISAREHQIRGHRERKLLEAVDARPDARREQPRHRHAGLLLLVEDDRLRGNRDLSAPRRLKPRFVAHLKGA